MISFFKKPFFTNPKYIGIIWIVISMISALKQYLHGSYNNYLIFKNVFWHTLNEQSLYKVYPELYFDHNHYGPIFSLFIAPFAILPDALGMTLWNACNAALLVWAVFKLPLPLQKVNLILWICLNEFITTNLSIQFNPIMTALIILSYVFIIEEKDIWAALCIVFGAFVKLYGVVGLAFFFFSRHKIKFIVSLFGWALLLFVLPMFISSPSYIIDTYVEWFERLVAKNNENIAYSTMQDISVMGIFRRVFGHTEWPNSPFLIVGIIIFGLPYLKLKSYKIPDFRLLLLVSVLLFTVLFSSGSESPTYIIAFLGVGIWFALRTQPISKFEWFLFVFAMILTSFSPTDIFPKFVRENYVKPYALKALPCALIWLKVIYEMLILKPLNVNDKSI